MDTNGVDYIKSKMPTIGLGTYLMTSPDVEEAVKEALKCGYRMIDTAQVYRNEKYIGEALKECERDLGIKREEIFLISKLHPRSNGAAAYDSVKESLRALDTNYIDLFLIHWPGKTRFKASDKRNQQARIDAWRGLEKAYEEGLVRAIGVSNFELAHLEHLFSFSSVHPAVNQCEFHPLYRPNEVIEWCRNNNVHFQAYSSLGTSDSNILLDDNKFQRIAAQLNCTIPQLLLAYALSQGISVLPKSTNPCHIRENFDAIKIKLNPDQIRTMEIEQDHKLCWDPSKVY
ncbi:unnamed protein product [Bursaphelenchus xylophilus]|uniref:(pine wood nematode) hypothetical protein n=1 Tax=Bursaphelenchus xylophilus TaxID=6326 RepID=A0A1I7S3B4_BURXY|nr:unnamed protein product [Bursaphelenchus xylophilus]CAG9116190.1 unnamed protein product [Bursaphelenchus xylophilus]